jgi:putative membrane protein
MDQIGVCERIKKTPMPVGYVLQLRRFVVLYCLLLPFALAGEFSWRAPVIVSFIAFSFFGIEFIGAELEDPFQENANAIDLKSIVETIHRDVKLLLEESYHAALS